MKHGCPKCEYQIRRERFKHEVLVEFKRGSPGPEADTKWPIETIAFNANVAARAASSRKGNDPRWSVTMARMVEIYRGEVNRMRAIDNWNVTQGIGPDDEDDSRPARRSTSGRSQLTRRRTLEDEDEPE